MHKDLLGPVFATVTDNKDPESLGRIKVAYKTMGEMMNPNWLNVLNIFGGTFSIPEVDSQVIVAFSGGNPGSGLVLGNIWTNTQKPPGPGEAVKSMLGIAAGNTVRSFITKGGNKIILDDKAGAETIQLINANGKNRIEFCAKSKTINIKSSEKLVLDAGKKIQLSGKTGTIDIKENLEIKAKKIQITVKDKMDVKVDKIIEIDGQSIDFNG